MSMLSKLLFRSRRDNPANAAMPWQQKALDTQNYYVHQGQGAGNQLNQQYSGMAQDPNAHYNDIMKNYTQSDSYKQKLQEGLGAAGNSAAAGGMRGSPMDQDYSGRLAAHLQGEDMQSWYNNLMGIETRGQAGQQHIADQGFNAAGNQANQYNNMGNTAAMGKDWESQRKQAFMNQLMSLLGTGAGAAAGGYYGGGSGALAGAQGNYSNAPQSPWLK